MRECFPLEGSSASHVEFVVSSVFMEGESPTSRGGAKDESFGGTFPQRRFLSIHNMANWLKESSAALGEEHSRMLANVARESDPEALGCRGRPVRVVVRGAAAGWGMGIGEADVGSGEGFRLGCGPVRRWASGLPL